MVLIAPDSDHPAEGDAEGHEADGWLGEVK
jgi:hypothetical protein